MSDGSIEKRPPVETGAYGRAATRAATCAVAIECEHGYDVCPVCDAETLADFDQHRDDERKRR